MCKLLESTDQLEGLNMLDILAKKWMGNLNRNIYLLFLLLSLIHQVNATSSAKKVLTSNQSWSHYRICARLRSLHQDKDVDVYQARGVFCADYVNQSFTDFCNFIKDIRRGNPFKGNNVSSALLSYTRHDQRDEVKLWTGNVKIKGRTKLHLLKCSRLVPRLGGSHFPKHVKVLVTPVSSTTAKEEHQNWICVCEPGGLLGFQKYNTLVSQSSEECQCPSGCPLCPAGQVLNPFKYEKASCICVSPLLLVVRLIELSLEKYTMHLEENLRSSIGLLLHMPSSQIFPFARRAGSVIVDNYIFSSGGANLSKAEAKNLIELVKRSNGTSGGILKDPVLGQFTIVAYQNLLEASNLPMPSDLRNSVRNKFLLPIILLSMIIGAIVVLISVTSIVVYLKKKNYHLCSIWFKKEEKRQCSTSLMSQSSRSPGEFLIYDNSCFHMAAGCFWMQPLRKVQGLEPVLGVVAQRFLFSELYDATGGFCESNLIGVGGSSMVYCGKLKDGRLVAMKRLNFLSGPVIEHDFLLEVELLSRLHHFHVVSLLGYCSEIRGKEIQRILVYEFMANGNLREHLSHVDSKTLNWDIRFQIAIGAARGLEYLHEFADPRVLHRDFKSQNILLDYKWRAKIADFGMAKVVESSDFNECASSPAQMLGTFGYLAPEYATTGKATTKSDVFSFGVVLLELISGRQSLDMSLPMGERSLVQWALPMLHDRHWVMNDLVDSKLKLSLLSERVQKLALIARACLQADPELRPSMTCVVQALIPLQSGAAGNEETEIFVSSNTQTLRKDCSSRYRERDQHDCSNIITGHSNTSVTHPSLLMLEKANDQKIVDFLSLDEDTSRRREWQRSAVPERTSSLSSAENLLGTGAMLIASNPVRRCLEEEALDLLKPRLEYLFWEHGNPIERL